MPRVFTRRVMRSRVPKSVAERRQNGESRLPSGVIARLLIDLRADLARDQRAVGLKRTMPRDVRDVAHHNHRLIDAGGLGGRRQLQFQLAKACFGAHDRDLRQWIERGVAVGSRWDVDSSHLDMHV